MDKETNKSNTEIQIEKNGPIRVEGEFEFINALGEKQFLGKKIYLCRCGQSENMPFCDKSHKENCIT